VLLNQFLILGAVLFCIGVYGVIARRNAVLAFSLRNGSADGHTFALYVIAVAAAEVGVGLAMVLLTYRNRRSIGLDELAEMRG
jgi:NADH:ubiquinone oxidoreductase subunit K